VNLIDAGLMARVQALLDARQTLPRAQHGPDRPRLHAEPSGDTTDLLIYDEIGWFGICAQDVVAALADVKGDLNVRINSPGGDVFDGIAIFNILAGHDGNVTVTVDGLAASAASVIAMAGDTVRMSTGTQLMIHDASGFCYGNAADMTELADLLNRVSDTIASVYADRTGVDLADWRGRMRAETWYSAQEAVDAGLADEMAPSRHRGEPEPEPGEPENQATPRVWSLAAFRFAGRENAPDPPTDPDPPGDVAAADDVDDHARDEPEPPAAPEPADPAPADEPATPEPDPDPVPAAVPDDWAAATAHLTTSPDDEWANLTEALT
jgi:ATP-dependent protease ClpP protease subunit